MRAASGPLQLRLHDLVGARRHRCRERAARCRVASPCADQRAIPCWRAPMPPASKPTGPFAPMPGKSARCKPACCRQSRSRRRSALVLRRRAGLAGERLVGPAAQKRVRHRLLQDLARSRDEVANVCTLPRDSGSLVVNAARMIVVCRAPLLCRRERARSLSHRRPRTEPWPVMRVNDLRLPLFKTGHYKLPALKMSKWHKRLKLHPKISSRSISKDTDSPQMEA